MRIYKVELVLMGHLTQLPDSQKLFGALVYMFSEKYGSDKAAGLVKSILNKETHLALSNLMPLDYFPTPRDYLIDLLAKSADSEVDLKIKHDAIKDRNYVKLTELKRLMAEPKNCENIFPYVKLQDRQQLRASIESIRYDIPELDSNLYSVPTMVPQEVNLDENGGKNEGVVSIFHFYLQVDDDDIGSDMLCMLNAATAIKRTVVLGKRASQGLNTFEFSSFSEQDIRGEHPNFFLNMGMLLPNEIDFASSTLKLFTSERRPFEMAGGWDKNSTGQFISFIAEGSMISAPAGFKNAGKSIPSPFNNTRDIVFGNAFLYPMPLSERGM